MSYEKQNKVNQNNNAILREKIRQRKRKIIVAKFKELFRNSKKNQIKTIQF